MPPAIVGASSSSVAKMSCAVVASTRRAARQAGKNALPSSSRAPPTARHFSSSSQIAGPSSSPGAQQTSLDPSEIAHFTRLSSTWWDPHGELGLLHKMNKGRVQFLKEKVLEVEGWERAQRSDRGEEMMRPEEEQRWSSAWLRGKKVLDVGCGGGLLSESLARLGANVHGIDATSTNIGIALAHASRDPSLSQSPNLTYTHTTAESLLPQHQEQYDVVASVEVLEHVSNPAAFLRSLDALLKPGGHLLLSTINRNVLSWVLTIGVAEKLSRLVSPGTHDWGKFVRPEELEGFIEEKLGWVQSGEKASPSPSASKPSLHATADLPVSKRLRLETRGIVYDPLIADWRVLDRAGWMQRSGWGQGCNYLLWARKPLTA
ncbi:ubiquinone biosynthesis O-methyltransferase [Jaminaea rosea]|uniref:Ubiquinone biosynthesis O-methyltransferase, mitochondrial n=1 Tax=Jaminaea rosea TaxID=1569628 RepID=A0A316UUY1_9BASI|nr:ubiquinone biosynthesis O-methyltransferase [Jaminaea rosea]PWN28804.1 ubiquinone biosynthesis O-methyltransferase [Jaminaea rosea]